LSPAVTPGNAIDVRDSLGELGEFGLFMIEQKNIGEPGRPSEPLFGLEVSASVLHLLGARAELGRIFLPGEDKPHSPPVMMLMHSYWRERFGGDPGVIGKTLRVETTDFTVVGVLSPEFDEPLLWQGCKWVTAFPVWGNWRAERSAKWMSVMGRLRPGISLDYAQARLAAFSRQLALDYPVIGSDTLRLAPLGTSFADQQLRFSYWLVVGLAVFVLVIACANLGGLQLARTSARQHELAIRAALGARRSDLMAALAVENAFIALAGTALGVLGSFWSRSLVSHWLEVPMSRFDGRVLAFAAMTGLLAAFFFGLLPAWLSTRNLAAAMKETSHGSTAGRSHFRARNALIVSQLCLALILVSTAASFVLGVRAFIQRDRGWQPSGLVSGGFHLPWSWVQREAQNHVLSGIVEEKLRALPGVELVCTMSSLPLYDALDSTASIQVEGTDPVRPGSELTAEMCAVSPSFFATVGLTLQKGRLFSPDWKKTDPPVAVVSAKTAQLLWPNSDAIGKRIRIGDEPQWVEVVGIVGEASYGNSYSAPTTLLQIYRPIQNAPTVWYMFALRTGLSSATLEHSIRAAFHEIDPDIMVVAISDALTNLADHASMHSLSVSLITFAVAGLMIAMIGLYAVMDQFTRQRQREIGVRIALGADRAHVINWVLGRAARMLGIGALAGIAGSSVVSLFFHRAMPELPMFGIFGESLVAFALFCVGLVACYTPSARAASVDPVEALRGE
jgi:predicted permease